MRVRKQGTRARGLVFRTRFRTSNHARNASRSLTSKFGEMENFRFRIFGEFLEFEILRISRFVDFYIPCRSRALPRQRHVGEEAVRAGHAAVSLEHVSARPAMPARPHDRSGATLGKSKICDFGILVVRFGPPLPFLALSCAQSLPIGGTFRFLQNLSENIGF